MYYSAKTSRHRQNGLSYVPKKILTWMLREAWGGLKATVGNRVKPDYHFTCIVFLFFSVSFSQILVFPGRLCSKAYQHILDIVGLKADFLSSQKPLAASSQVLAGSRNNFLSSYGFDNLMNIGLAGLSNRDS